MNNAVDVFFSPQVTKKEAGSFRAVVSDRRGEDVSALELLDDGETVWRCHRRPDVHKQQSPLVPVCISTFHLIMKVRWLISVFPSHHVPSVFSRLIMCPQYSAVSSPTNLAFSIHRAPEATWKTLFFLFTEYDKLLQQLSKQCGELFIHEWKRYTFVECDNKMSSTLAVFGMRMMHLNV